MKLISYKNGRGNPFLPALVLLLLLIDAFILSNNYSKSNEHIANLSKCIDGDTAHFDIDGKDTVIRFLAIDTPETVKPGMPVQPYGKEASEYTCNHLKKANVIKIEYDQNASEDKYGRVLAWIFVDDLLLQEKLVEQGYAEVKYLYDDYKYTDTLIEAQQNARDKKLGIWSSE